MKKALILILTAFLFVSLFIACGPEPIPEITIRFDGNGAEGQMQPQKAYKGEEIILQREAFIYESRTFIGWNTEKEGRGESYLDGDTVSFKEDTTLYAQWHDDVVEILFNANGGKGAMFPQWAIKGEATTLRQNRFSKEDCHFIGWKDGSDNWYSDSDTASFEENTTLYAQWAEDVVTIKFDANGGSGVMFPQWAIKGEATALRPNRFSLKDYHFVGWNTKADGSGTTYPDGETIIFNENTTLYAQWAEDVVTIKFDANGGSGVMFPQWAIKGEATALRPNRFSLKDHVFLGWNTKKDGSGTKYADKSEITTASDITLYAQWAVDIVTLEDKYNWKESDSKYFSISADLTLDDRVLINGNVTLFLPEGKSLNLSYGIGVNKGNSLTIDGSGTLKADTSASMIYSGIGSYTQEYACGDITINGGNIYAEGGPGGAGIGGSCYVDGGTITINGGTVEAVGGSTDWLGYGGAGIGGGGKGSGGTVIINGGKVTVKGGENSDGIGKGQEGKDKGKLTLGKGVSIEVSDDGKTWSPYKSDKRHRYMRTKQ